MFDVRDALVELTGVLPRGAQPGDAINIARSYGREMYVLTILQRTGDVVAIPKLWWHAVRSTPGSVAISVPVRLGTIDGRTVRCRTCRHDAQPVSVVRGQLGPLPAGELPPNSAYLYLYQSKFWTKTRHFTDNSAGWHLATNSFHQHARLLMEISPHTFF